MTFQVFHPPTSTEKAFMPKISLDQIEPVMLLALLVRRTSLMVVSTEPAEVNINSLNKW